MFIVTIVATHNHITLTRNANMLAIHMDAEEMTLLLLSSSTVTANDMIMMISIITLNVVTMTHPRSNHSLHNCIQSPSTHCLHMPWSRPSHCRTPDKCYRLSPVVHQPMLRHDY